MNRIYFIWSLIILLFGCGEVSTVDELKDKSEVEIKLELYIPEMYDSIKLTKLGIDSLRIKRNEIFARRGLIFKSKELQEFFSKLDWYIPKYDNVDSLLNKTDKKNIELVKSIENFQKEKLNYFRNLPNMQTIEDMSEFLEIDFQDYSYWNKKIPEENDSYIALFVNGKKEFPDCIYISYYTYEVGQDGTVPPAINYSYRIDVYDKNGLLVHSNCVFGDPLAKQIIKENKIYYHIKTYKSIYSEAEQDSSYYDELHMEESGIKEIVFYLNSNSKTVDKIKGEK